MRSQESAVAREVPWRLWLFPQRGPAGFPATGAMEHWQQNQARLAIIARVKPEPSHASDVAPLGIIMLDTQFARPLGDAGNPASWPFPVIIERVPGAFANDVVTGAFDSSSAFIDAARFLRGKGCICIISTCGFLARVPQFFWADVSKFVRTSTLFSFARLSRELPIGKRVAILTIDASSIDATIRQNCAIPPDAIVVSPPRAGHFCRAILDAAEPLDSAQAERELVETALTAQRTHPEIGLWLFECANMPPYRQAVERATGVHVYDALQMGIELHAEAMAHDGVSLTRPSGPLSDSQE